MFRKFWWPLVGAAVLLAGLRGSAEAAPIFFEGSDAGSGPGEPRVNCDAAANAFAAAAAGLGGMTTIDFESAPHGGFDTLALAPGVNASLTGMADEAGIRTTPTFFSGFSPTTIGFNTTPGGSQFLGFVPEFEVGTATLRLTFAQPVQGFGVYVTGLSAFMPGDLHVEFEGNSTHDVEVLGLTTGGVQFFGFIDEGAAITTIDLHLRNVVSPPGDIVRDIMAVDDVSFIAAVPEPSSLALVAVSLATCLIARGSRFRSRLAGRSPISRNVRSQP